MLTAAAATVAAAVAAAHEAVATVAAATAAAAAAATSALEIAAPAPAGATEVAAGAWLAPPLWPGVESGAPPEPSECASSPPEHAALGHASAASVAGFFAAVNVMERVGAVGGASVPAWFMPATESGWVICSALSLLRLWHMCIPNRYDEVRGQVVVCHIVSIHVQT